MFWSTPIFFPIAEIFHLFFLSRKSPTFISFSGAPKKRRGAEIFLPFSDFFCDIIRLDGKPRLYTWLFIQLFFLGKYNQAFNNFPKSKTNLFSSFISFSEHSAILSHIFFFGRKSPTFIFIFWSSEKEGRRRNFSPLLRFFLWYYKIRWRNMPIYMTFYSTLFFRKIQSRI